MLQYAGDNLLAAFGADEAAEDDAERAVRCGLALLELGAALQADVKATHGLAGTGVRIGIHTGGVLLGGGVDKDGSIRGQAVNIAARMEQTAPAGALRISHDTYRQVRGVFDVEAQPPLAVKGVDAPVQSYLVLRAKPRAFRMATRGVEGVETRMIGRDAELAALQAAFARLVAPGAGLERIVVVSEAGVGKSRLLHEFESWSEARPEGCILFQARATPQTRGQAYGLLRDLFAWRWQIPDGDSLAEARHKLEDALIPLFKDDAGRDAGDAEAQVHLLGQLIGFDFGESRHVRGIRDDPRQIHDRGFQAAAQVLRRLVRRERQPIVMFLDDLHWADDGSLDFVDHLARVDRDVPMLIVSLARPTLFERRGGSARRPPAPPSSASSCARSASPRAGCLAGELLQKLAEVPGRAARPPHRARRRQSLLHGRARQDADRPGRDRDLGRALVARPRAAAHAARAADADRRPAGAPRRPAGARAARPPARERDRHDVLGRRAHARRRRRAGAAAGAPRARAR